MKSKEGHKVSKSQLYKNRFPVSVVDTVTSQLVSPSKVAQWLLSDLHPEVKETPDKKGIWIETLLLDYPQGGTIRKDGFRVSMNPFQSSVANIMRTEKENDKLLTWFPMKHGRKTVKDHDGDNTTMGKWLLAIYIDK